VLAGGNGKPARLTVGVRIIARIERLRLGPRGRSALVNSMALGAFSKPFERLGTLADWLSLESAEVDRYIADPLCRFRPALQLWIDLLDGMGEIAKPARHARIPKQLPIYVIAGPRDGVGTDSKGLEQLLSAYHAAGLERVTYRYYPEARHEFPDATSRGEVTRQLLAWLNEATGHGDLSPRGLPRPTGRRPWA
jgi:alpha-beta hydrolase superfamily lysophospholipase